MHLKAGEPGCSSRVVKVWLDDVDVTIDCCECDTEEGWVDVFERDPAINKRKKVTINGQEQLSKVRIYGRVRVEVSSLKRQS